jgi:hypothetical protein
MRIKEKIEYKKTGIFLFLLLFPYLPFFYVPSFIQIFFSNDSMVLYFLPIFFAILVFSVYFLLIKKWISATIMGFILPFFIFILPTIHYIDDKIIIWWNSGKEVSQFSSPIVGIEMRKNCETISVCFVKHEIFVEFLALIYNPNYNEFKSDDTQSNYIKNYKNGWWTYHNPG